MFCRYITSFILCLYISGGLAQPPGAKYLIYYRGNDIFEPVFKDADSALRTGERLLQKAKENKDKQAEANANNAIGLAYYYKGQLDSAIQFYKNAKNIFIRDRRVESVASTDIFLAKVYISQYKIDVALKHLIEADSLCLVSNNIYLQADVQWNLGLVYKNNEEYAKASVCFKKVLPIFKKAQYFRKYIAACCNLSMSYRLSRQNDSSLAVLQECISAYNDEQLKDSFLYAEIQENLGDTYLQMDKHNQALLHFKKALGVFSTFSSPIDIAYQQYSIGLTLSELNEFQQAKNWLFKAYRICDSLQNFKYLLWISKTLAEIYIEEKDWYNAYIYLQKTTSLKDTINIQNQVEKTNALNKKFETEKKEKEIALLKSKNQIIVWAFISGMLVLLIAALLIWLNRTRQKIKEEKILNYFATSLYNQNTIEDVFWDIAKNCISQLGFEDCVIYEFDESRNILKQKAAFGPKNPAAHIISNSIEIPVGKGIVGSVAQTLKPEIIKDTRLDNRYLVDDAKRNAEITVPILVEDRLLGIIDSEHHKAGFFTKRHLTILLKIADICSKKVTRYFVEEGLRKKIARDLHDDMGSTLSSINIISKVALQQSNIEGHLKNQLTSIKDYSLNMMENMGDMVWAINPQNDTIESLISKMKEWAAEICEPREVQLHFETSAEFEHLKVDAEKRKHLFLIFKEAINNAIKYSQCKNIYVKMKETAGARIQLFITDDGIGFDMEHHKSGNGLMNMTARAQQLQADINIISAVGKGTVIELRNIII